MRHSSSSNDDDDDGGRRQPPPSRPMLEAAAAFLLRFWSDTYMAWPSLAFGVGPVLAAALGFLAAWGCICALDAAGLATLASDGIRYGAKHSRADAVRETEASVPYTTQVNCALPLFGLSLSLSLSFILFFSFLLSVCCLRTNIHR